ncbi:hypothetical protein CDAR_26601 [Caerostris darwini]|uniref:Uncharacterized protein n=1 Tax=Caerostris darwini TaxID=1538125 RepID=A0AAV4QHJ4_9ARAC|nr:hypothetical protein CDAR_26601 [Caerostris darwini]
MYMMVLLPCLEYSIPHQHFSFYSLNLSLNCLHYPFMNTLKKYDVLRDLELYHSSRKEELKKLSPTRWIERHESIMLWWNYSILLFMALALVASYGKIGTQFISIRPFAKE